MPARNRPHRCKNGHDLDDPANVYISADRKPRCRICTAKRQAEYRQRETVRAKMRSRLSPAERKARQLRLRVWHEIELVILTFPAKYMQLQERRERASTPWDRAEIEEQMRVLRAQFDEAERIRNLAVCGHGDDVRDGIRAKSAGQPEVPRGILPGTS